MEVNRYEELLMIVMMPVALVLAGCGHNISEGTIFVPQYHSASYYVKVQGADKNEKDVVEKFSVSKEAHEKYQVGISLSIKISKV